MKNNKDFNVEKPRLPLMLENMELWNEDLQNESYISSVSMANVHMEGELIKRANFHEVIFKGSTFIGCSFERAELVDVRFENCDLSNVTLENAIIHRVEFVNCKIIGINLSESNLRNVSFHQCNGKYGFFGFSNLKEVKFNECDLGLSDFQNAIFSKVGFYYSNISECQMSGTKLKDIDLTSCDIEGISVRIEDLKGAIVSPIQAVSLSKLMGVIVR